LLENIGDCNDKLRKITGVERERCNGRVTVVVRWCLEYIERVVRVFSECWCSFERLEDETKEHICKYCCCLTDTFVQFVAESHVQKEELVAAAGEDRCPPTVSLLCAWKDFLIIAAKHLPFELTPQQKYFLADDAREALIQELENMGNLKSIVVLAELCLILATKWERYEHVRCPHLRPLPRKFVDRSGV
jgi:hypothetical protein